MKEIKLTKGSVAIVDDEDFDFLSQFKWYVSIHNNSYVRYAQAYINNEHVSMHRLIMHCKEGDFIDHKDGNGLNNQKMNLRFCTKAQNKMNSIKRKINDLKFKGIFKASYKNSKKIRYHALITINGKTIRLGTYISQASAASAYDKAARKYFGEFAKTNFNDKYAK